MELNHTSTLCSRSVGSGVSRSVKPWLTATMAVLSFLAATNSGKAQPPCTLGSNYDLVFFSAGASTHGGIGLNVTPAGILTQFRNGGTVPIAAAIPAGLQDVLPNPGGGPSTLQFAGATSGNVTFDFCHAVTNPVFYIHGTGILGSTTLTFPVPVILEDDGNGTFHRQSDLPPRTPADVTIVKFIAK